MIRKLKKTDISTAADIWLRTNITAHGFIPAQYWKDNFESVKKMFLQAEMYVYEDDDKIQGLIGLSGDHIAGIFVRSEAQSKGIGKQLLDFVKNTRKQLTLNVYQKNTLAIDFYKNENFKIRCEGMDENTGEKEYSMIWTA